MINAPASRYARSSGADDIFPGGFENYPDTARSRVTNNVLDLDTDGVDGYYRTEFEVIGDAIGSGIVDWSDDWVTVNYEFQYSQ